MAWQPILNSKEAKKGIWKPVLKVSEAKKRSQFENVRPRNPLFDRTGEDAAESALFKTGTPSTPRTTDFGTGDLAKALGQGVMQGFGASGAALKGLPEQARALATDTPVRPGSQSFTPTGAFQKGLYGTDKPISLETGGEIPGLVEKTDPFKPFGVEVPGVSNAMAVSAVFGVLDLTGAGGVRGLKGLSTALKSTKEVGEALTLLKQAGFSDDIAQQYAPLFAKEKNTKKIEEGLLSAEKLQNSTKAVVKDNAGTLNIEDPKLNKSLVVVHNLTEEKLRFADRIGGLSNPSMAVIDPRKNAFESFGDITLVADPNLIRGEKTHLADAYTARFPSVHTSMSSSDFKRLQDDLDEYYKKIGEDARKISYDDTDMARYIENNPAVALKFLESRGVKPSVEGQHYYHSQILDDPVLSAEYVDFLDELYAKYNLTEQMFAGYTTSGKRRYKPVSLTEASKIMGKQREEGFNYGLGSFRSKIAPIKKTPEAIKKEEGRLVTKEQFDVLKKEHDDELFALADELAPYAKITDSSNRFIESDSQVNAIGGVLSGEKDAMKWFNAKFPNAPSELVSKVIAFREKLKAMPTEYFETKFKRPVGLEEFKIALVPEGTSEKTIKLLEKKGLRVITYEKGKKQKAMNALLKQEEAFGVGAGIQTDEEGNVTFSPESAALGVLGVAGLTKGAGKTLTKEALSKLPPSTSAFRESIPQTARVLKEALSTVLEYVQNTEERVRKLVGQKGLDVSVDPYETMTLYHGRVGDKIEQGYNAVQDITDDVIDLVGRSRTDVDTGRAGISKYLQALHAPERNAALGEGAAGMTTAEARQIVAEASPEVKAIAQKALTLHKKTLDLLHDSGVLTDELYTTLREKYKNHVPLQRIFEGDDMGDALSGRGFDVRSTGIKTAKGSEREVADILTNIVNNYEQAVLRSEKNIVDNATLAFVRNNEENLKGLIGIRYPRAIGKKFGGGIRETVDELTGDIGQDIRGTTKEVNDALSQAEMEVLTQLELSQAGFRNITDYGIDRQVKGVPSTFPKWVPEHLREKALFTKVIDLYNSGKIPRGNASKERELLELVQDQIAARVPLDVRDEIALTELAKASEVRASLTKKIVGKEAELILEQTNDPKILQMYENGKRTWIEFKDERLATAFRGVGREKLGAFMQGVGAFTRFYASLMTRFNYEFALPNKIRDLQETLSYMASQKDVGFKGAANVLAKDVSSIRDIAMSLVNPDSKYAKMYQEMKSLGGTTGGLGLSTRKQTELNIDKIFATARSRPRQAASKLIEYVDNWNTIFEDSTRLSVYKAALDRGLTKERAAFLAKEASINFNRMGKGGPLVNALYMFANASIQGSVKMLRAMKNPKVAAGVFSAVGASVAAVGEWNDTVDPEWRDKVTEWDRDGGLPVMLPTTDGSTAYFTIPVSWGIKPILVMSNAMYDTVSGQEVDATHAAGKIFSSFIDAYNPVGGSDLVSSLTPTAIDVPTEITRNEAWSGSKIRPDYNKNLPRDLQYFESLEETAQGRASIAATEKLREATGLLVSPADLNYVIDQYIGGAGRSVKKINEVLYGLATGDVPPADEWPMVSRFLRLRTEEETGQGAGGAIDKIRSALSEQEREKFEIKNEAVDTFEELSALPKDVATERFNMLKETNPEIAKKVVEIANDKKLGLNYTERLIKQLNVQNGERAAYIAGYLKALGSKEEKSKAWQNFVSKKILTTEVAKQVTKLLEE